MPSKADRLLVALAVGTACVLYWLVVSHVAPTAGSDFDQLWHAARVLREGGDPYAVVRAGTMGPARVYPWDLYYPLPAVLSVIPFSVLPIALARGLFSGLMLGGIAYMLSARGWWGLLPLMSAPAFFTLSLAQWNGVVALAVLVPTIGALAGAGKPNAYAAVAVGEWWNRSTVVAAVGALVLCGVSFVVLPSWLTSWIALTRNAPNFTPLVLRPGGFLLLGALFWYRSPRARWIAVTAITPLTPIIYAALPLLLYEGWSRRQLLVLCLLSHCAMWVGLTASASTFTVMQSRSSLALIWLLYLPAMGMMLLPTRSRRANVQGWQSKKSPSRSDGPAFSCWSASVSCSGPPSRSGTL